MKKLVSKKLGLRTETLRILDSNTLPLVAAGRSLTCPCLDPKPADPRPGDGVVGGVIPVY